MKIHYVGRNIEVTPALKTFVEEKMQRLQHHQNNITQVNVVFHVENIMHTAEANIHMAGTEIHATAEAKDMYAAIDDLVDKLVKQITKHKEKLIRH